MAVRLLVGTDERGRPTITKVAVDPVDVARIVHEAELLAAAAHPGVVEVLRAGAPPEGGFELVTRLAGSRTAADLAPGVATAAGVVAAAASTLADLHGLGIVHGRVTADHVVIGHAGSPVLCGFGGGGRGGELDPRDDVAGLGHLLRALVGGSADWEPIPERRWGRARGWGGFSRRALLTLADHATADDRTLRPSARALAAAVRSAVPDGRVEDDDRPRRPEPPRPEAAVGARRWPTLAAGMGGAALILFGLSALARPAVNGPVPPPAPASATTPAPTAAPVAEAEPGLVLLDCAPASPPAADHDGDGCVEAVVIDGGVVEVGGVRYAVGRPGDRLAVADWDCDGVATVAALRPGTGEVFVFASWAVVDADVEVSATAAVADAVELRADDPDGDGCPTLVVVDRAGQITEVRL